MARRHQAVAALAILPAAIAGAHHSYTMFDMQKNVTLEGTVKEVQWTNPHIWLQLVGKDTASGEEAEWSLEGNSPNMLIRAGWSRKDLKAGDKVTVVMHPVKAGGTGHTGSIASVNVNGKNIYGGRPGVTPIEEGK